MVGGCAVLVAAAWAATTPAVDEALYTEGPAAEAAVAAPARTLPELSRLAETAMPAVVGVVTTQAAPPSVGDDALRDLFERLHESPRKGIGSGFVIHRDGWILTNAHVVEGAEKVEVDLGEDGGSLAAKVVGADAESDIALLKVDAKRPLTAIPLGDSDRIAIAEWVFVIGSPFGLDHTVTVGVVSHVGRSDISPVGRPGYYDFIQTDASINPGNSGGPVLNLRGEVVGIATAVNATGQGIGFAIPINMAKGILPQLKSGRVVRSWLGVAVREPPKEPGRSAGVVVTEVASGGPADAAGVKVGDVITSVAGHAVNTPARLRWYVSTAGVGRRIEMKVRRGQNAERTFEVQLAEVPPAEQARAEAKALLGE